MKSHIIKISGRQLHYVTSGAGPPFVFLHGHRADVFRCQGLIEKLALKYKVYAPDLPGFGQSEPLPGWHHLERYPPHLCQFVKKVGLTHFTLGGVSMGATLAVLLAQELPQKIKKLVLLVPVLDRADFRIRRPSRLLYILLLAIFPRTKILTYLTDRIIASDRVFKRFLKLVFPKNERSPKILTYETRQWRVMSSRIWAQTLFSLLSLRCHRLKKLPIPTVAIYAGNDQYIYPSKAQKRLKKFFPNTRVFVIPNLKHVPKGEITPQFLARFDHIFSYI